MIKTIEEVHPNPFSYITRDNFYKKADSIKQTITGDITRLELQQTLSYFINSINDGHTQIKFPELSNEEDNKAIFDQVHSDSKKINTYKIVKESIGYLNVKDFVIDKRDFYNNVDSIFAKIHNDSISNLIIDIRNNPGGNSELADYLISCIYSKPHKANSKIRAVSPAWPAPGHWPGSVHTSPSPWKSDVTASLTAPGHHPRSTEPWA